MVVDGIAESPHETWMESEDKVRESISEKLKMDHRNISIVVKFLRFKNNVFGSGRAKNLRGMYIFLNEDYPDGEERTGPSHESCQRAWGHCLHSL